MTDGTTVYVVMDLDEAVIRRLMKPQTTNDLNDVVSEAATAAKSRRRVPKTELTLAQALRMVTARNLTECVQLAICELSCDADSEFLHSLAPLSIIIPFIPFLPLSPPKIPFIY